jgi:GH25 family lysozyme M1 (1,4-beta-N-acetylmuramidase)
VLAAVTALALPGGFAAILCAFGGSSTATISATAQQAAVIPAATAAAGQPSASQAPRQAPIAPVTALPTATATGPPVVNGIRRGNVGSGHSPRIQKQLTAPPVSPPPTDAGALGVDVAGYQHPGGAAIDWNQVAAAGYRFAFIKATEGNYYGNPYYAADLAQATAAGLYAAGYHFAIPDVSSGTSQADYAVQNSGYAADGRTLPLALDIEYNPYGPECYGLPAARMVSWLQAFADEARRRTGQLPVIYTTADWWRTCTGNSAAFGASQLWIAAFRNGSPPMPAGWANWTFWQYTSRATVPGISTRTDVSYFLSSAVRLLDPGSQRSAPGAHVALQVTSLNATDGQAPQFTAANLPPGLTISASGRISGTIPTAVKRAYHVTVTAVNASGGSGSVSFRWTVSPRSQPSTSPSASPSPSSTATVAPPSPSPSPTVSPTTSPTAAVSPSPSPSASPPDSPSPFPTGASPTAPDPPFPSPSPSPTLTPPPAPPARPTTEVAHDREA